MEYLCKGKITQGVGGLYTIALEMNPGAPAPLDGMTVVCHARGAFRHANLTPLPGDDVRVRYSDASFRVCDGATVPDGNGTDIRIEEILPRRNALIRPPMANLDYLFVSMAAASPQPLLPTVDKLISIAEYNAIEPIVLIGKTDLSPDAAERLCAIYRHAGFETFTVSCARGEGIDRVRERIHTLLPGKIVAFSGASGVGKSTLINHLFPTLRQLTGEISQKNERGKNTTREVTLFPLSSLLGVPPRADTPEGYLADTPGFSLLDFTRFDFFTKDDLPGTMREFTPYLGKCRYTGCTHIKDEGCAVLEALSRGEIEQSRFDSFVAMYEDLKDKHPWDKK